MQPFIVCDCTSDFVSVYLINVYFLRIVVQICNRFNIVIVAIKRPLVRACTSPMLLTVGVDITHTHTHTHTHLIVYVRYQNYAQFIDNSAPVDHVHQHNVCMYVVAVGVIAKESLNRILHLHPAYITQFTTVIYLF